MAVNVSFLRIFHFPFPDTLNLKVVVFLLILCYASQGAPQIPASARRTLFMEPAKDVPGPEKNYTGIRLKADSKLVVYHHEQTIAVVEVGDKRELFNCELLEVKTKPDKKVALNELKKSIRGQIKISFSDMKNLMEQCQKLDPPKILDKRFISEDSRRSNEAADQRGFSSLFSGVFPGTKWCGTGDIAASYFDIGAERQLDKCCRTHDLCPVKVSGLKTQYNITNYSLYTKSHCDCDTKFFSCLKSIKSTLSDFMGNIYFNVAQVSCVEEVPSANDSKAMKKRFKTLSLRY